MQLKKLLFINFFKIKIKTYFRNKYKTQKRCDKAVNTYHSTIEFVPDRYKTQEMCD